MDYFTIDGNYYTSNLNAYVDYLKDESQTTTSSDLQASLEEILDAADSESVVTITDSTLKEAGEDYVNENKDKLAAYGVTQDKIQNVFNSQPAEKSDKKSDDAKTEETSSCPFERMRAQNAEARAKTESKIKASKTEEDKNNNQRAKVQAKITQAQAKNEALNAQYNALKTEVTAEQEAQKENNTEASKEYEKNTTGKVDSVQATKTQKYQQIDEDSQRVKKQNDSTEGFKADSSAHFEVLNVSINSATDAHDSSTGYTLAGVNMTDVGAECSNKGVAINSQAITLAQQGFAMMSSKDKATAAEGAEVYERSMNLVDTSMDIISDGHDVIDGSYKYYEKSNRYTNNANMFMTKATPTLSSISANNDDITAKINELQSQKTK